MYGEATVDDGRTRSRRNSTSDKWSSHPCAAVMLDDICWFDEQRPLHNGLCCTQPVGQGRLIAIIDKLGRSNASAVWVHERWQTQKEEKAFALDSWRKWNGGWKLGSSFRTRIQCAIDGRAQHVNPVRRIQSSAGKMATVPVNLSGGKQWTLNSCIETLRSLNALLRWVRSAGNTSKVFIHDSSRPHARATEAFTQCWSTVLSWTSTVRHFACLASEEQPARKLLSLSEAMLWNLHTHNF